MSQPGLGPFSLPVTYWPQRTANYWWDDFRADEVAREFDLAAASGLSTLHLILPWDTTQPHSERISLELMRNVETVLLIAHDTGLRCLLTIGACSVFDVPTLPHWFYELSADERSRLVRVMRKLYEDPLVIGATWRLVDELTGEYGRHPSTAGWVIGDGMLSVSPPRSSAQIEAWLDRIRPGVHEPDRGTWHGISARDIGRQAALSFHALTEAGFGALIHIDWKPLWAHDMLLWMSFLTSYVRALGGMAPMVSGSVRYCIPAPDATEDSVEEMIAASRLAGAAGVLWPALFDYDPSLRSRPPFSTASGELSRGLLPTGGRISGAAEAWLNASANPGDMVRSSIAPLDEDLRARDPEGFMRLAYRDFIG